LTGLGAPADIVDRRPDVVVLDLGLPGIDGLELDDEGEIIRTLDAGADDYVVRPYFAASLTPASASP
jgi:DNA-binding response OmpR family regulator